MCYLTGINFFLITLHYIKYIIYHIKQSKWVCKEEKMIFISTEREKKWVWFNKKGWKKERKNEFYLIRMKKIENWTKAWMQFSDHLTPQWPRDKNGSKLKKMDWKEINRSCFFFTSHQKKINKLVPFSLFSSNSQTIFH